jgi:hypothetical protein
MTSIDPGVAALAQSRTKAGNAERKCSQREHFSLSEPEARHTKCVADLKMLALLQA